MMTTTTGSFDHLRSMPWWNACDVPFAARLEERATDIRSEFYDVVLSGRLRIHPQSRGGPRIERTDGDWNIFALVTAGRLDERNALEVPVTAALVGASADVAGHPNGLAYFSVLHPHVHVDPHCGPTNKRIRIHLGLVVPPGAEMRVGTETRAWHDGRCIVFDDSFEHEIFNRAERARSVLLVDVWHPDLTPDERAELTSEAPPRRRERDRGREGWFRSDADSPTTDARAAIGIVGADRRAALERVARAFGAAPGAVGEAAAYFSAVSSNAEAVVLPALTDEAARTSLAAAFASYEARRLALDDAVHLVHLVAVAWRADPRNRERTNAHGERWSAADRRALLASLVASRHPAALFSTPPGDVPFGAFAALAVTALRTLARE